LNLKMKDINLDQKVIYIEKSKTKQTRIVPLSQRALTILQELGPELFNGLNKHDVTEKFREYLGKAGLVGFKLHSLRHTFSCWLVAAGVDLFTISRLLGHTDIKTTMVYAKVDVSTLKSAVSKLEIGYQDIIHGDTGLLP
jgi:integrase